MKKEIKKNEKENDPGPVLQVSECLIVGVDISNNGDDSCIQVVRQSGIIREIINTYYGEEAEKLYDILTNGSGSIPI